MGGREHCPLHNKKVHISIKIGFLFKSTNCDLLENIGETSEYKAFPLNISQFI